MKLAELSQGIGTLLDPKSGELDITSITHDSRRVQYGSIYVAMEGKTTDGHDYIGAASQMGAVCVMTAYPDQVPCSIPILQVENPRKAMAEAARRLYGYPDQQIKVIGITGTNGKTTFTYLVSALLQSHGKAGRLGTLSYFNGLSEEKASHTTPESCDMFRLLGEMAANGCHYAALEISSHGLMYERVRGMNLRYAVFSNLSRDHLDFHGDMESYFQAKQKQFDLLVEGGVAVVNWDDEYGRRIKAPDYAHMIKFGMRPDVDLRFEVVSLGIKGSEFDVFWKGEKARFKIPLIGKHNIYNYTSALAVALSEGRPLQEVAQNNKDLTVIPGRMEMLDLDQDFGIIIDFAHSPDALEKVLEACSEVKPNKLIVVFGAGGNRDTSKRAEMGRIVDQYADVILLTSDNPRNENPEEIMEMVQQGIKRPMGQNFFRNWDRRQTIETAIAMAGKGDMILIAGKGHETTQEINGVHHPFNDRIIASEIIRSKRGGSGNV